MQVNAQVFVTLFLLWVNDQTLIDIVHLKKVVVLS